MVEDYPARSAGAGPPAEEAAAVSDAIAAAADTAGRIAFGPTPVRFPFTTAVVDCYGDAK
ncbi:hypothetical protein [Nocardia neocaledoniensis]|uniref:hypothetical protein n=1 Tax=Nocardia neocaledoniensis TaxID=236511 RepID=UPI002455D9E4|nr:hypothetical protein [Nocardia neocaledoniensis]